MVGKKIAFFMAAVMALTLCACSGGDNKSTESSAMGISSVSEAEESSGKVKEVSGSGLAYLVKEASTPDTVSSSLNSPLEVGEWGTAAKLCLKDGVYVDVPVRLVSLRRGNGVNEEVKKKMEGSHFTYYFEPQDNEEYVLAEYEICLDGFPVKEGGTLCDITTFITGSDGQAIKLKNGSYWGASASCLDNETYFYEGVVHSEIAWRIPKEVKEYILTFGEYGENQAFVSIH